MQQSDLGLIRADDFTETLPEGPASCQILPVHPARRPLIYFYFVSFFWNVLKQALQMKSTLCDVTRCAETSARFATAPPSQLLAPPPETTFFSFQTCRRTNIRVSAGGCKHRANFAVSWCFESHEVAPLMIQGILKWKGRTKGR